MGLQRQHRRGPHLQPPAERQRDRHPGGGSQPLAGRELASESGYDNNRPKRHGHDSSTAHPPTSPGAPWLASLFLLVALFGCTEPNPKYRIGLRDGDTDDARPSDGSHSDGAPASDGRADGGAAGTFSLTQSLIGYWKFDETRGSTSAADASGVGNHGYSSGWTRRPPGWRDAGAVPCRSTGTTSNPGCACRPAPRSWPCSGSRWRPGPTAPPSARTTPASSRARSTGRTTSCSTCRSPAA